MNVKVEKITRLTFSAGTYTLPAPAKIEVDESGAVTLEGWSFRAQQPE